MSGDTQYERDKNLATRIAFHENYTVPYVDFSKWVFEKVPFASHQHVLEKATDIEKTVAQKIDSDGAFTISKRAGIFLCR
jgi:hypothetical protein